MKSRCIFCILLSLMFAYNLFAADDMVSKRIEGVAAFLVERANESAISLFEAQISKNPFIKDYFPNTSRILETFNLKLLMLNDALWKSNVEKDLNDLLNLIKNKLKQEGLSYLTNSRYKELVEFFNTTKKIIDDPKKRDTIDKFIKLLNENLKALNFDQLSDSENLEIAVLLVDDLISLLTETINFEEIQAKDDILKKIDSLKNDLKKIKEALEYANLLLDKKLSYTTRVSYIFIMLEQIEPAKEIFNRDAGAYRKFKNLALFFTQLSDAKDQNEVKVVLRTFALPQGSYLGKRKDELHFSISAYLGFAAGIENLSTEGYFYYGLTAPIGLELSKGITQKSSISLLLSVIDLGAVVNSQIYGTSETFDYKDIFAPGVAIIYGFADMPLAFGIGYFRVNGLKENASDEQRVIAFLAADIPLFAIQ